MNILLVVIGVSNIGAILMSIDKKWLMITHSVVGSVAIGLSGLI